MIELNTIQVKDEKGEAIDAYLKELENLYIQLGRLQEKLHRLKNPNDGKPWSIDDDLLLLEWNNKDKGVDHIAKNLGRTKGSIDSRINRLRLEQMKHEDSLLELDRRTYRRLREQLVLRTSNPLKLL